MRRIAANNVIIDGQTLTPGVIELMDGRVVNYFSLVEELPMTEWLGGTIIVRRNDEGILQAFKNDRLLC